MHIIDNLLLTYLFNFRYLYVFVKKWQLFNHSNLELIFKIYNLGKLKHFLYSSLI